MEKKMLIINILDVLKRHSDCDHKLSQQDILDYLTDENGKYKMNIERKAIKRNLMELETFGYNIEYATKERSNGSTICTDFYIIRDFSDVELKYLMDSVIFSHHIPKTHRKEIIEKLGNLSSTHFKNSSASISVANTATAINQEWFTNLDILNDAINNNHTVRFNYYDYGVDKKLHLKAEHTVNPYRVIAKNDHYYLVCQEEPFDNLVHYRIDKMKELKDLKTEYPPIRSVDMDAYLAEHPYMSSGKTEVITLRIERDMIGNVIDWFGDNYSIDCSDDSKPDHLLDIRLRANPDDLFYWALQYGKYVEVLYPQELRDRIRDTVESMARSYLVTDEDRFHHELNEAKKHGFLNLRSIHDLDSVRGKEELLLSAPIKKLALFMPYIKDCSFVEKMPSLDSLYLYFKADDLSFLSNLTDITRLKLYKTGFNDIALICNLPLEDLDIGERHVEHLELLEKMTSLRDLRITRDIANDIDVEHLKEVNPYVRITLAEFDPVEL